MFSVYRLLLISFLTCFTFALFSHLTTTLIDHFIHKQLFKQLGTMYIGSLLPILPLLSTALAAPEAVEERRLANANEQQQKRAAAEAALLEKRQADISQLLSLASIAGVGPLPTDPAVLLQLGPVAGQLASALPTSPVLSVLETAAPKPFISNIVNNPAYASSFEKDFSAGKSPDWFTALPSSVKSYLHTYKGFGELATDAAAIRTAGTSSGSGSTGSAKTGSGSRSGASATASKTDTSSSTSGSTMMTSSTSGAAPSGTAGAAGSTPTSSSSSAGAAQQSAVIGLGAVGAIGVLGLAVAL